MKALSKPFFLIAVFLQTLLGFPLPAWETEEYFWIERRYTEKQRKHLRRKCGFCN